jgi:hypothetical protein
MNIHLTALDRARLQIIAKQPRLKRWLNKQICWHEPKIDWEYGNMQVHICINCGKRIINDKAELDLKAKSDHLKI